MLVPKLVTSLQSYDRRQFTADLLAGVIVGVVAIPLAIAFAIASGVGPERGLYTAIVAGFLISALGGSRVQIGGPTGAFVVIVAGIVAQHGYDGLQVATIMAGVLLVALGLARLGGAIKFVPFPVIAGFTAGIAIIILSGQVKDLLGLRMASVPSGFGEKWVAYGRALGTASPWAVAVSAGTLAILLLWPRVSRRVPAPFVALLVTSAAVALLELPVETIGSRFGALPTTLPTPSLPSVTWATVRELVSPALTIAMLAGIESLLSAVVADGMIGSRHRSDMELVAQGVANIASPIVGGIPATGALARTATNVKNGGRTPVAGMVHALTLLAVLIAFGRWAALVPMPTLAAILTVVAWHMGDWQTVRTELRAPRSDVLVLVVTFLLTVMIDLTVAVQVGVVLSAFLFMRRMSEVTNVQAIRGAMDESTDGDERGPAVPKGVELYSIQGPFFFGAASAFRDALGHVSSRPRALIIRLRDVPAIDATGIHTLRQVLRRARADGTQLILTEVHAQPMVALARSGLLEELGEAALADSVEAALARVGTSPPAPGR